MSDYLGALATVNTEPESSKTFTINSVVIFASLVTLLAVSFALFQWKSKVTTDEPPDSLEVKTASCDADEVYSAEFLIIDASDEVASSQLRYVEALVQEMTKEVVPGKRIYIFQLTARSNDPLRMLGVVCDERLGSMMKENPASRKRKANELRAKINDVIQSAFGGELPFSPIIEGIADLTRRVEFTGGLVAREDMRRRLWLLSDGLQNSPNASVYKKVPSSEQYQRDFGSLNLLNAQVIYTRLRRVGLEQDASSNALIRYLERYTAHVQLYRL